ncbi:glycosyltransferase [Iamia sp.]|uniref:glycosyltransferase n=1 Tax=Iamia sp. TaxID=2722710 RepID=UPI002CC7A949|nr:glycosyltransferase [Iamia sp.]HXH58837.1 glycosyltransferase [Iamia sp.]
MARISLLSLHTSPLAQPGTGDSGGMNVYVRELAAGLAHAGNDCRIFVRTDRSGLPPRTTVEPGVTVEHVPAGPVGLAKEDLVTVVDEWADAVASALDAEGGTDVLHSNYWLSGVAGHRLKHLLDRPLVSTFHTLARVKTAAGDPEPEARGRAEAAVMACSDAVLASCPAEADQLAGHYGVARSRLALVAPGVEHALFSPGPRGAARAAVAALNLGDRPVVLFVGRIQRLKGLDVAVRSLAAMKDPRTVLVVVGGPSGTDGEACRAEVDALVVEHGLADRVRFVDPRPHHELSTLYRAADAVVVPSRSESFGLVALEAAACGRPVVAADIGGLSTLVEHGRTGLLVRSRDPRDWARALDSVVGARSRNARMGRAAAGLAQGYGWDGAAHALAAVYATVTSRGPLDCAA